MIAFVVASSLSVAATEIVLVAKLDSKLGSKLGTILDRELWTVVVLDIKLDIEVCKGVVRDNELGSKMRAVDGELCMVIVLDIKLGTKLGIVLGTKLGTVLGSELGATRSKMNISIPTGNRRL